MKNFDIFVWCFVALEAHRICVRIGNEIKWWYGRHFDRHRHQDQFNAVFQRLEQLEEIIKQKDQK
jgi:hypothetical protein